MFRLLHLNLTVRRRIPETYSGHCTHSRRTGVLRTVWTLCPQESVSTKIYSPFRPMTCGILRSWVFKVRSNFEILNIQRSVCSFSLFATCKGLQAAGVRFYFFFLSKAIVLAWIQRQYTCFILHWTLLDVHVDVFRKHFGRQGCIESLKLCVRKRICLRRFIRHVLPRCAQLASKQWAKPSGSSLSVNLAFRSSTKCSVLYHVLIAINHNPMTTRYEAWL